MFCVNCGCKVDEKDVFCNNCGFKLKEVNTDKNPSKYKKDNSSVSDVKHNAILSDLSVCIVSIITFVVSLIIMIIHTWDPDPQPPISGIESLIAILKPLYILGSVYPQAIVAILSIIYLTAKKNILLIFMLIINSLVIIMIIEAGLQLTLLGLLYLSIYMPLELILVLKLKNDKKRTIW